MALDHEIWKYYQSTSKVPANVLQNLIVRYHMVNRTSGRQA